MPKQIAFAWSKETEKELIKKGFEKEVVYTKSYFEVDDSDDAEKNGDRDFFDMKYTPYMFITTSWWGAGDN